MKKRFQILTILILLGVCTYNYGQEITITDSNHVQLDLKEFKYVVKTLAKKLHFAEVLVQKDLQIQSLQSTVTKLDSIVKLKQNTVNLYKEENKRLQPTFLDYIQDYGFFVGLIIGLLIHG